MKNYSTTKIMTAKKERTTGNPKSKMGSRVSAHNKKNKAKTSKKMGY